MYHILFNNKYNFNSKDENIQNGFIEMLGYGMNSDGYHFAHTDPSGNGAYRSMKKAISGFEKEIRKEGVMAVNCHATSTKIGDESELKALSKLADELGVKYIFISIIIKLNIRKYLNIHKKIF